MPRVMLTIRDEDYRGVRLILRSDKGLASVISALSGAVSAADDETYLTPPRITLGSEVTVDVKTLPAKTRFCVRAEDGVVEVPDPETRAPKPKALNGQDRAALDRQAVLSLEDRR
jgi:hypothetical protein